MSLTPDASARARVMARAVELMRTRGLDRHAAVALAQREADAATREQLGPLFTPEPAPEPEPPAAPAEPPADAAPSWRDDPFAWCLWYLHANGHIYRAFRAAADELFERHPNARTSAETILQHLRYLTPATAAGDPFKINNNARSLFARIYIAERPSRRDQFERRTSHLDSLSGEQKWALVRAAQGADHEHPA